VDLAGGKVKKRIAVGRLPVQMAASPEGQVYALTHTDQSIWVIDPVTDRARVLARLPESPQDMVYADGALWVLLWSEGSSKDSSIARVDPANGKVTRSARMRGRSRWDLGGSGWRTVEARWASSISRRSSPNHLCKAGHARVPVAEGLDTSVRPL
jgi:DNA-binding beta-propeller fold protein YncE